MPDLKELLQSTCNRLILINVVVYFVLKALFAGAPTGFELHYWQSPDFQIWQLFSYMFLHADLMHLFFNMFGLWMFGRILENAWGSQRFLVYFLVCGVGAAIVHIGYNHYEFQNLLAQFHSAGVPTNQIESVYQQGRDISASTNLVSKDQVYALYLAFNSQAVGASGALYGVLVAFALLFPNFKIMLIFLPIPVAAKYFVPVLLLIDLSAGLTGFALFGRNIAHFAHLGGALAGFLLVQYWLRPRRI